jgi:Acetyltransferase (GNAT) domain
MQDSRSGLKRAWQSQQANSASTEMSGALPAENNQPVQRISCYQLDPIQDPRWAQLVEKNPKASVFHTVAWLRALQRTYGYEPVVFTTSPPTRELENGLVFCRVNSWLTGRRLVSLPFSDHCEPLCDSIADLKFLIQYLQTSQKHADWKHFQVRSIDGNFGQAGDTMGCVPAAKYFLHTLDLRPDLAELYRSLDKDSVQRRIERAERAGLVEECNRSEDLLKVFYHLFVITRSRQCVPPTPYAWFHHLIRELGHALAIRVAYKDGLPIAAIITLKFKDVVYYKYGCSDARFNKFGPTPWLFWRAITNAKLNGANTFDLGRTEPDNQGLLAFKNHWVQNPERLVYWQYPNAPALAPASGWKLRLAKRAFSHMPDRLLTVVGGLIYRHVG